MTSRRPKSRHASCLAKQIRDKRKSLEVAATYTQDELDLSLTVPEAYYKNY